VFSIIPVRRSYSPTEREPKAIREMPSHAYFFETSDTHYYLPNGQETTVNALEEALLAACCHRCCQSSRERGSRTKTFPFAGVSGELTDLNSIQD